MVILTDLESNQYMREPNADKTYIMSITNVFKEYLQTTTHTAFPLQLQRNTIRTYKCTRICASSTCMSVHTSLYDMWCNNTFRYGTNILKFFPLKRSVRHSKPRSTGRTGSFNRYEEDFHAQMVQRKRMQEVNTRHPTFSYALIHFYV